ncbi:MAG: beta-galactosidase [Chloroflexota bacterium]
MPKQPSRNPRKNEQPIDQTEAGEVRANLGATETKSARKSSLPLLVGGGIALALLCAIVFVIYSFFFFEPGGRVTQAEATPTLEIVDFGSGNGQPQPAANENNDNADQPAQPVEPAEPAPTPIPPQETEPTSDAAPLTGLAKMQSPDFGIQAFLYWRSEVASRDLQLIKDIKFSWVKQQIAWRDVEGAGKGIYDWANLDRMMDQIDEKGLHMIARVDLQPEWAGGGYPEIGPPDDYQDYVDFISTLATRYKGRIDAYQIWNEPNLAREWGDQPPDPVKYTELLRRSYEAIKAIDPDAFVISAGLAPTTRYDHVAMPDTIFVQGMYDAGAQPFFDALGVHGAGFKVSPDTDPAVVANDPALNNNDPSSTELKRIYAFRHVEDVRAIMVANGDVDKRVVVLEFGWTVDPREDSPYRWHAVSENQQAAYIVQAYRYAEQNWQPWIGVMSLIFLANVDWTEDDEQTYWSITHPLYPDLRARPAFWGLMDANKNR